MTTRRASPRPPRPRRPGSRRHRPGHRRHRPRPRLPPTPSGARPRPTPPPSPLPSRQPVPRATSSRLLRPRRNRRATSSRLLRLRRNRRATLCRRPRRPPSPLQKPCRRGTWSSTSPTRGAATPGHRRYWTCPRMPLPSPGFRTTTPTGIRSPASSSRGARERGSPTTRSASCGRSRPARPTRPEASSW